MVFCSDRAVREAVDHCTFLCLSQALGRGEQNCLLCTELALGACHQDGDHVSCSLVSAGHGQGGKIIFLVTGPVYVRILDCLHLNPDTSSRQDLRQGGPVVP